MCALAVAAGADLNSVDVDVDMNVDVDLDVEAEAENWRRRRVICGNVARIAAHRERFVACIRIQSVHNTQREIKRAKHLVCVSSAFAAAKAAQS